MDHFQKIYAESASEYHQLIAHEDADGNLLRTLRRITSWSDKRVLDIGSGTGRLPLLLANQVNSITALDLSAAMLAEQRRQQTGAATGWPLVRSDMRRLPFAAGSFDVVTAGWAIGHCTSWFAADWKSQMAFVLAEMQRVAAADGHLIILETMSTGTAAPAPPTSALASYYGWLESAHNFHSRIVATDYAFATVAEAAAHTGFFFGRELAALIVARKWTRVPEWTGIWHLQLGG